MSANSHNQNMDSWKSGNRYEAMSDFPSLSEASTEKQRKTRGKITLVLPFKTYKDELREKYTKTYSATENHKTKMCNSLDKNVLCWHLENCLFAHDLEELVIRDCHFKDKCRFIKLKNGKLLNDGSKTCCNKHPQESKDDFINRTGLSKYKTKHDDVEDDCNLAKAIIDESSPGWHGPGLGSDQLPVGRCDKVEKTKVDDTKASCERQTCDYNWSKAIIDESSPGWHGPGLGSERVEKQGRCEKVEETKVSCDRQTNYTFAKAIKASLKPPTQESTSFKFVDFLPPPPPQLLLPTFKFGEEEKEIVLRVPKVLAMQALELAMNSGNRCIRVEVIE